MNGVSYCMHACMLDSQHKFSDINKYNDYNILTTIIIAIMVELSETIPIHFNRDLNYNNMIVLCANIRQGKRSLLKFYGVKA